MEIFNILCLLTLNYFATDAYMRVERAANCPGITDFPGRVKYRRKGTRAVFKCPKKFDRYGSKFATCQSDGTWSNDPPLCIKTGCVPLDPSQVTNLDMEVVNGALVKFTCLAGYLLIGETQAYCNGKDWSAPLPRCAAPHELTECDFEEDLCGWTQDDDEEQDWIRQMGPTQTGNTGPKHDHTLGDSGNGHYLYFETSNPTMAGHKANLLSPVYTADLSPMCFDFWYHILGPEENGHVGSLEVFILDQSQFIDDDDVQPVFVKEGNQGDMWHRGDIFIDTQPEPYQIAVVATRALSYISDIAFDDVRLYNCTQSTTSAPKSETTPTVTTTTTTTTSTGSTTTTVKKTVTSSATPVITKTTKTITTTESPTKTTIKTETVTESPTTTTKSTTITESPTSTATKTTTVKPSSSTKKPTPVATSKQTTQATTNTSPNTNTWSSVFTKTTMITPKSTKLSTKTTTTAPTETTEKTKTFKPKTSANTSKSTYASSSSTTSRTVTTASPVSSQTSSKSTVTTSFKTSTATPKSEHKSTVKTSIKSSSTPITTSSKTTTFSERTTESPVKTDAFTRDSTRSSTSGTVSTTSSSSFSTSSSSTTSSSSSSRSSFSSSSSYSTTSSTARKTSTESKTGETKPQATSPNYNTKTKVSKDSSEATKTVKPTKRTNTLTTKSQKSSNTSVDNSISVSEGRSQHPEDDTLKPLMIGLCVGIVAGLIIIGVIAYVCVRRRKFYTSRYEDELKPITNSASLQSLNNGHYYQDEEYESES